MTNKQRIYERDRSKRSKLLHQMESEIKELENKINNFEVDQKRVKKIRNLKIFSKVAKLSIPYVIATSISFVGFSVVGLTPFKRDDEKHSLNIMKEFDSLGNIRYEQQYKNYKDAKNVINYYGKWEITSNGSYKRNIETYNLGDLTEDRIIEIFSKENITLKETFGDVILNKTETKNCISYSELNQKPFLQAVIYSEDKNDYIVVKEPIDDNIGFTLTWILLTIFIFWIMSCCINSTSKLKSFAKKVKEDYPMLDVAHIDNITKKLVIKRDNYNRLTR